MKDNQPGQAQLIDARLYARVISHGIVSAEINFQQIMTLN